MVLARPNKKEAATNIKIQDNDEEIKPKQQFKILGWWVNTRQSMDTHVNQIYKEINQKINTMRNLSKYTDEKTRIKFANAFLMGRISYGMPLYQGETCAVKSKIHAATMLSVRYAKGSYCFKMSINRICRSIGWDRPELMIQRSTIKYIQKIIYFQKPKSLIKLLRLQRTRTNTNISVKYHPRTSKFSRNVINQSYLIYNQIPNEIRQLHPNKFRKKVKAMILK